MGVEGPRSWAAIRERLGPEAAPQGLEGEVTFRDLVAAACKEPHSRENRWWRSCKTLLGVARATARAAEMALAELAIETPICGDMWAQLHACRGG